MLTTHGQLFKEIFVPKRLYIAQHIQYTQYRVNMCIARGKARNKAAYIQQPKEQKRYTNNNNQPPIDETERHEKKIRTIKYA